MIAGSVFSVAVAVVISDTKHLMHVAVSCRLCPVPVGHRVFDIHLESTTLAAYHAVRPRVGQEGH